MFAQPFEMVSLLNNEQSKISNLNQRDVVPLCFSVEILVNVHFVNLGLLLGAFPGIIIAFSIASKIVRAIRHL